MNALERRIGLILAKAESTDNPHERDTFLAAAERMMLRTGISEAAARAAAAGTAPTEAPVVVYTDWWRPTRGVYTRVDADLVGSLARLFGCRPYRQRSTDGRLRMVLVGYHADAQRALSLARSLGVQAERAGAAWWTTSPDAAVARYLHEDAAGRARVRRTYREAFYAGALSRLEGMLRREVAQPGTALVLAYRDAAVTEAAKEAFPDAAPGRASRRKRSRFGVAAGYQAGRVADVGQAGMGSGESRRLPGSV